MATKWKSCFTEYPKFKKCCWDTGIKSNVFGFVILSCPPSSSSISIQVKINPNKQKLFLKAEICEGREENWWIVGVVDDNISFIVICNMHVALWFEFLLPWVKKPILHMEAAFRMTYGMKIEHCFELSLVLLDGDLHAWINVLQSSYIVILQVVFNFIKKPNFDINWLFVVQLGGVEIINIFISQSHPSCSLYL